VAFYVPLGPRGLIFRLGTFVIGIWGGLVYRLAYRRRIIMVNNPGPLLARCCGIGAYTTLEDAATLAGPLAPGAMMIEIEAAAVA
jgi:hypothetical protein